MSIRVRYFASLRDRAGAEYEDLDLPPHGLAALYEALRARHGFALDAPQIRVAVNGEFVPWSHPARDGDEVVFLPPVSGG